MSVALDHVFIGCRSVEAGARALEAIGLTAGSSNTHEGQGTANRRFFFENFMLELLYVNDPEVVRSPLIAPTRLAARCAEDGANRFGIVLRPSGAEVPAAPFATWRYFAPYLGGHAIEVAEGTALTEPELFYLPFPRRSGALPAEPLAHRVPLRRLRKLRAGVSDVANLSASSRSAEQAGFVQYFSSEPAIIELQFEGNSESAWDLRPTLPLLIRAVR
jgi:hypothetical protein